MKNLKDIVLERLVLPKDRKPNTKIPSVIYGQDNKIFKRIYKEIFELAKRYFPNEAIPESELNDKNFQKYEDYVKQHLPKSLQTKEKIWAFISCTLGYDYMFNDEDPDLEDYLSDDWEDDDPVTEFTYRALYSAIYEEP